MGHIHLGHLPETRKWREVVALIDGFAAVETIVAASATAAEKDLQSAASNPVFVEAVRLLALIPQAARSENFSEALFSLGIDVPPQPSLTDLLVATNVALDRFAARQSHINDFGDLSARALTDALAAAIGYSLPSLFASDAADMKAAALRVSRPDEFARMARDFFGRLTSETLSSWLDRELSAHVGPGKRFANLGERSAFNDGLARYCTEATRIIREFAGGWYGKTLYREGTVSSMRAASFGAVSFKKIVAELRRKRSADE
jgi:hypothetical protein